MALLEFTFPNNTIFNAQKVIKYDVSSSSLSKNFVTETGLTAIYGVRSKQVSIKFTLELNSTELETFYNLLMQNYTFSVSYIYASSTISGTFYKASQVAISIISKNANLTNDEDNIGIYQVSCTIKEV